MRTAGLDNIKEEEGGRPSGNGKGTQCPRRMVTPWKGGQRNGKRNPRAFPLYLQVLFMGQEAREGEEGGGSGREGTEAETRQKAQREANTGSKPGDVHIGLLYYLFF